MLKITEISISFKVFYEIFSTQAVFCVSVAVCAIYLDNYRKGCSFAPMNDESPQKIVTEQEREQNERLMRFGELMLGFLDYTPNESQSMLIAAFSRFCLFSPSDSVFLLNGYAGTGKTSMTGALVKTLAYINRKTILLAPTGRAAKVFSEYSEASAFTIHRKIYRQKSYSPEYGNFSIAENKYSNAVFIVDEASMIGNASSEGATFGTGRLLDDLIHYVYSGNNCRLIILGDNAQLPPVGFEESPALSAKVLAGYGLTVYPFSLTEVVRQGQDSGILDNATRFRNAIDRYQSGTLRALKPPRLRLGGFTDIEMLSSEYLLEKISDCYDRDGISDTIIITRSNKRATLFNLGIRNQILYREDELVSGDLLLVAKNNYYWSEEYEQVDFIANGDVARVARVRGTHKMYGFRFADVTLEFPDHQVEIDAKVILDALTTDAPALTHEQNGNLFMEVQQELEGDKRARYRALKKHPYFNALQVKYGYTVTCHKAQGGQWKNVFIDMGAIPDDSLVSLDFYRWLYTALTRATQHVYLINSRLEWI